MGYRVLITGGAGFIGSHTADALLSEGHYVRVFDNLDPQVHGKEQKIPEYLNKEVEFIKGDITHRDELKKAIEDIEIVFHEASVVGVGQSMYEVARYNNANILGTAILWDILINEPNKVEKVIIASSMSTYGEGEYECEECGIIHPPLRSIEQLLERAWELRCYNCGREVKPIPTREEKPLQPTSVYAMTKKYQEEMSLLLARSYKIPTVILRYFNVYGPRQALSNPYTGVVAIFPSRILNKQPPIIFEDGQQSRDFIHVSDIVCANLLAMKSKEANYEVFNVGTGQATTILKVADLLIKKLKSPTDELSYKLVNKFREGDIRHCYADTSKIKKLLGFEAKVKLEDGLQELIEWASLQEAVDLVEKATYELEKRGLMK